MAKDPAFLLYSKDWIEGTADMTLEEKGAYIDLLCFQHQRGFIPEDSKRIALLLGIRHDDFIALWDSLKHKFAKQMDGKLVNNKLNSVCNERSEYSKMRTIIGTFGAQLRAMNLKPMISEKIRKSFNYKDFYELDDNELSSSIANWIANCQAKKKPNYEDEDEIEDIINIEYPFKTDKFKEQWIRWKKYKSEQHNFKYKSLDSEKTAINKLFKDSGQNEDEAILMIENSIANGWQGIFKDRKDKSQQSEVIVNRALN